MKISLDTNILIDTPEVVFDDSRDFVISFTVIRELDKLKRNPDLKRVAQQAIKNIWNQYQKNLIEILDIPNNLGDSPDEIIIQSTKNANASILSEDIAVRLIAKAHGVSVSNFEAEDDIDYNYTGYIEVDGDLKYEQEYSAFKEIQLEEFNEIFKTDLKENQYYIINRYMQDKYDIWVNTKGIVHRISQSMKPFRDAGILLDPMDSIQMCALDAVIGNSPLVIIDGSLGTGKTLISLMSALAVTAGDSRRRLYDKILVTKPPVSINKDMYTGFKPGTSEEKMGGHLGGIKSNLKFLLNRRTPRQERRFEDPKSLRSDEVWEDYFGVIEIDEIQGTSLHNTILMVDEYQLLNVDTLKLVLSRIAEGSKVVLIGDTQGQTYGYNRGNEGFKVLYKHLGNAPEMTYLKLENIYRSKLAEFVSKIFDD